MVYIIRNECNRRVDTYGWLLVYHMRCVCVLFWISMIDWRLYIKEKTVHKFGGFEIEWLPVSVVGFWMLLEESVVWPDILMNRHRPLSFSIFIFFVYFQIQSPALPFPFVDPLFLLQRWGLSFELWALVLVWGMD